MEIIIDELPIIYPENAKGCVKPTKGIYFWFDKSNDELVYIGIGTGDGGLKKRIVTQHLNPKYIEFRPKVHNEVKDSFQLSCAITRISKKDGSIERGIDKSAFRKTIGRTLRLRPGEATVNYIKENLYFKMFECEDVEFLKSLEKKFIKDYQPKFNTAYK